MCSERQKDTSGLSIIMDEESDDDKHHRNTTGAPNSDEQSNPQYAARIVKNKFRLKEIYYPYLFRMDDSFK